MSKSSKSKDAKAERKRQPWRENIEALSMAIVVALVLKVFILEVSKIPSGSMQPTLMGNPAAGVFDRVIVDKVSFQFRDPERFEIIVFRHPLERSRNMVKRVVGMPDEWLRIQNGDIWTRKAESDGWQVLRRPESVQDDMWRPLGESTGLLSDWKPDSVVGWKVEGDSIEARGAGRAQYRPGGVRNEYFDGYHEALAEKLGPLPPSAGEYPVGDLRLDFDAELVESCDELVIELSEGLVTYRFRLPGPAAAESARPSVRVEDRAVRRDPETGERIPNEPLHLQADEAWRARAGSGYDVRAQNLDDLLQLYVDGDLLLELEVAPVANQSSGLAVELAGGGGELDDLEVYRDVYYLTGSLPAEGTHIAPGNYFMLGDNTLDSADGREWKQVLLEVEREGEQVVLAGNFRGGNDPLDTNPYPNLAPGQEREVRFRDLYGERHHISGRMATALEAHHTVPRELIQGRAVAIFWPIQPFTGVWRLGWIH